MIFLHPSGYNSTLRITNRWIFNQSIHGISRYRVPFTLRAFKYFPGVHRRSNICKTGWISIWLIIGGITLGIVGKLGVVLFGRCVSDGQEEWEEEEEEEQL